MPRVEHRGLKQKAVLWAFSSFDNYNRPKVAAAVELLVHWDETPTEILGPENTPIAIDGMVEVDREIAPHSILRLGAKIDLPSPVTGGLMEVVSCTENPDIKGARRFARFAGIRKYRNTLPELA